MLHGQIDPKIIPSYFWVSLCTVYNIKKTIDLDDDIQTKPGSSRVNRKWNQDFIYALKTEIVKDPKISICKIAAELKVDLKTERMVVHDDPALNHIPGRSPWRPEGWKGARKYSDTWIFMGSVKIFSDEKICTVVAVLSRWNDRYLSESITDVKGKIFTYSSSSLEKSGCWCLLQGN